MNCVAAILDNHARCTGAMVAFERFLRVAIFKMSGFVLERGKSDIAGFFATNDQPLTIAERISAANAVAAKVVGGRGALVPTCPEILGRAE